MGSPVPKHVAIILDGNRRFSRRLMMKPWKGHEWGAKKVEQLLDWCKDLGIRELTLYSFSVQNFSRPKEEFDYLMDLFRKEFDRLKTDPRIEENGIRVTFIGRLGMFPNDIQEMMRHLMEKTRKNSGHLINFAMGYGGREEVIDAVKRVCRMVQGGELGIDDINEQVFGENLYMQDEPDLIIRTGGDKRTSNFLIWQSHYAEWIFLEKTWPEFEKEDLVAAIQDFSARERRFGT
ncbi:di-trans,poly-cis-decaprenylcistransferase [Candidatus Woesearchaeota archaeon]|nr:di-trans,poly-cis-decaprenylcistransferase [Candidatus Woesearchaeota archaeon]